MGVTCPDCDDEVSGQIFCAHIAKGGTPAAPDFAACVSIDTTTEPDTVTRTYGGSLLQGNICHYEKLASLQPGCTGAGKTAMSPVKSCTTANAQTVCGSDSAATNTACGDKYTCETGGTGKCNGSAVCG